eukprot:CAMPEP_0173058046 /NCGR_PEP_ID=MMETSP1102-20130122/1123_1 /TAXON_ID=49646 /ORGANISM="Geminigera sp., Strain Caron Lab Isolate" /LENGTH=294 /DNA_ID=CAMNT_0013923719 /DNA_START=6 /DNA_END=890 /DNA_ORIENTATION=+
MLKKQLLLPAIAVALLAGVYYLSSSGQLPDVKKIVTENKDYLQNEAGVLGMAGYVLVDIALIVTCQPGSFFMELVAGYVYGLSVGTCLIVTAKLTAAGICFYLGKHMLADWVNSMLKTNATFNTLKANSDSSGFMLVLGLRLSPVPSYLCSYGSSVMNVPFGDYMKATAACTAPMVINNVYMGQAAGDFSDLMSGKSSGGMADYAKIALPLVGTMVLCEWIRRFMATLTGKQEASGSSDAAGEDWVRRSSRSVRTPSKIKTSTPAKSRGKSTTPMSRGKSPANGSSRGKSPAKK